MVGRGAPTWTSTAVDCQIRSCTGRTTVSALGLLIADDNPDDAWLIAFAMKRAGFVFEWQRVDDETGFSRELPEADMVICNYAMPQFSPVRALEMIHASGRATPLLLVSGSVSAETAGRIVA